jgi:hypothetical protein
MYDLPLSGTSRFCVTDMRAKFGPRSLARNSLPLWYVLVQGDLIYLLLLFPHVLLRIQVEGNLISLGTTHSKGKRSSRTRNDAKKVGNFGADRLCNRLQAGISLPRLKLPH